MKIVKVLALVVGLFGTSVPTTTIMMGGMTLAAVTLTAEPAQACDSA